MMGDSVTIALTLFFCLVYFSGEVVVHKVKSSHRNKPRHHYRRTPKGRNTPRRKHVDLFHTGYHRPHALYLEPALAWLSAPPRSRHTPTPNCGNPTAGHYSHCSSPGCPWLRCNDLVINLALLRIPDALPDHYSYNRSRLHGILDRLGHMLGR